MLSRVMRGVRSETLLRLLVIATLFVVTHRIGMLFFDPLENLSAIWPASGVSLAAVMLSPKHRWPLVVLALTLGNVCSNLLAGLPILPGLVYWASNLLELSFAVWVLERGGRTVSFLRVYDVVALVVAASLGSAVAALLGAGTSSLVHGAAFWAAHRTWWIADGLGMLVVYPLAVTWLGPAERFEQRLRLPEAGLFLALWCGASWLVFAGDLSIAPLIPDPYALVALLAWPAIRLGPRVVTLALAILAAAAITSIGTGAWVSPWGGRSLAERLLLLQIYLAFASIAGLLLAASMSETRQARRASREAEARSRTDAGRLLLALSSAHMATWEWEPQSGNTNWSSNIDLVLGLPSGGFLRTYGAYMALVHPDDRSDVERTLTAVVEQGSGDYVSEHRIRFPDGSWHWMEGKGRLDRASAEEPARFAGTLVGIDVRRRAADEVRRANRALRTLSNCNQALVHATSESQLLADICRIVVSDGGYQSASVTFDRRAQTVEASAGKLDGDCAASLTLPLTSGDQSYGELLVRSDDCDAFDERESALLSEMAGDLAYGIFLSRARIAHERTERAVVAGDLLLRQFIKHTPAAVAMLDTDMRYLHVAERWLIDYHLEGQNIIGKSHYEVFPDMPEHWKQVHQRVLQGSVERCEEDAFPRADGGLEWLQWEVRPWHEPGGEVGGLIMFTQVITERKRTEETGRQLQEQLRQAQKLDALGTLAGGIAHDFNNILGAIIAYTQLARMDNPDNTELQSHLDEIMQASSRATDLVKQILSFSRRQGQERKTMNVVPVVREAMKLLRSTLPATIDIQQQLGAAPEVLADPTQIHQVLMNLGTNAAHAMNGRGRLTVTVDRYRLPLGATTPHVELRPGEYLRLAVTDTGRGMDTKVLSRIFEPFFTTKGPGDGTGLGLAVVHGIIKEHDGVITVDSEPGEGSTFTVFLPVATAAAQLEPAQLYDFPRGGGERVLFVDDEAAICSAAKILLERIGYRASVFQNPEAARDAFKQAPDAYDLMVTDLTMPGMTGIDLATELLRLRPTFPIILTSGYSASLTPSTIEELGIRELLYKPLDYRTLAQAIARARPS